MSGYLDKVNRTKVSAELLGEVLRMHEAMPAKDRSVYEVRTIRLFQFLDAKGHKDRSSLAVAIDFRLTALARLHDDPVLRAWTVPGRKKGSDYIHADLLQAAAVEPLIADAKDQVAFDAECFRKRVLATATTLGEA